MLLLTISIFSACAQASTVQLNVDSNGEQSGCEISFPNAGATLVGIDDILTANIDLATFTITEVIHSECEDGNFVSLGVVGSNIPVGLNTGLGGSDVVELSAPLIDLISGRGRLEIGVGPA